MEIMKLHGIQWGFFTNSNKFQTYTARMAWNAKKCVALVSIMNKNKEENKKQEEEEEKEEVG